MNLTFDINIWYIYIFSTTPFLTLKTFIYGGTNGMKA
jgi:hypothetical protein